MIHPTAIIDPNAKLAKDVEVGPYSVIGPGVEIGAGSTIGPHVVIKGPSRFGKNTTIFQFASVGEIPQDKKFDGEESRLVMGDNNTIREYVTINRGTADGGGETRIGNNNLFMACSHVAHDCLIGDNNILVNSTALAGHVEVGDFVIFSAFSGVHQFCQVGSHSFIAHAAMVSKDVPPYLMVTGGASPTVCGLNVEGLKRRGFTPEEIQHLRRAYKVIYREGLRAPEAIEKLKVLAKECDKVALYWQFLEKATRGILR